MILERIRSCKDVDTSDLAAKTTLIALEAEVNKLGINKLVNLPTSLINFKKIFRFW